MFFDFVKNFFASSKKESTEKTSLLSIKKFNIGPHL